MNILVNQQRARQIYETREFVLVVPDDLKGYDDIQEWINENFDAVDNAIWNIGWIEDDQEESDNEMTFVGCNELEFLIDLPVVKVPGVDAKEEFSETVE